MQTELTIPSYAEIAEAERRARALRAEMLARHLSAFFRLPRRVLRARTV